MGHQIGLKWNNEPSLQSIKWSLVERLQFDYLAFGLPPKGGLPQNPSIFISPQASHQLNPALQKWPAYSSSLQLTTHRDRVDRVRFNVPPISPNTLQVISGTGFYGSKDPTNSVKALKEERFLRSRPTGSPTVLTMLQPVTGMQYETKTHKIHGDKTQINLHTVKLAQHDKTQSTEL